MALYLNKDIRDRYLEFSKVVLGMKSFKSRWHQCIDIVLESLPIPTSALYVKHFFKKESREVALQMVDLIQDAFQEMLKSIDWMDEATKEAATDKAKKMTAHIGFPNELMDDKLLNKHYENLTIDENRFFESIINIEKFELNQEIRKLRHPVNKSDWETHASVAMVNAFFNPTENSIRKQIRIFRHRQLFSFKLIFYRISSGDFARSFFQCRSPPLLELWVYWKRYWSRNYTYVQKDFFKSLVKVQ